MKIYMDACCFNRPFDDQNQTRIYLEAEAILTILSRCSDGMWTVAASDVLDHEFSKMPDREKLEKVLKLYTLADHNNRLAVTTVVVERAKTFQTDGIQPFDALHLALAELGRHDAFLTTDDSFLRAARRANPAIVVANPIPWLLEIQ